MQTAPANWDRLWRQNADMELRAIIGGVTYGMGQIVSCKAYPAAFSGLAIGQAAAAELDMTFVPLGPVPKAAVIQLYARLTDGTTATAWVPQGTYYTDTREAEQELDTLSVTAFDRMIFAEEEYFSSGIISGTWPRSAPLVVSDICRRLGITLDSRSAIDSGLMVSAPINLTMRDVLRNIAAAHGGNFIITQANQLRLLPLEDLPDMTFLGDENGDFVADEYQNRILIIEGDFSEMDCEDARSMGDRVEISRVVLTLDDEHAFVSGDESGYTLTANCLYADQNTADRALARLKTVRYDPAEVTGAVFNPLLELGDTLYSGGNLFRVYRMEIDYDLLLTADLSAPIEGEVEHEIPYQSSTERLVNWKVAQTRAYIELKTDEINLRVENELEGLEASVDIKLDSITLRVQGAEGSISTLTQTANSLQSQITSANGEISTLTQTANSLQSQITSANGEISTLTQTSNSIKTEISYMDRDISRIEQKVDSIRLEVTNGEDSSVIGLTVNGITVSSKIVYFTGDVVFASDLRDGTTTISGDCIRTGEISTDYIHLGGKMRVYQSSYNSLAGGYMGYMQGLAASGDTTYGIGMTDSLENGQMICTSAGTRMSYSGRSSVTCTYNRVSLTGPEIVVNGTLKNADGTVITSDRNAKEDILEDLDAYLPILDRLRPVSFRLKGRSRRHLGFIAQEVEEAMESAGVKSEDFAALVIDEDGNYGLRYEEFIPLLAAKLRRLEQEVKELRQ